jgi:hypothetical protein
MALRQNYDYQQRNNQTSAVAVFLPQFFASFVKSGYVACQFLQGGQRWQLSGYWPFWRWGVLPV